MHNKKKKTVTKTATTKKNAPVHRTVDLQRRRGRHIPRRHIQPHRRQKMEKQVLGKILPAQQPPAAAAAAREKKRNKHVRTHLESGRVGHSRRRSARRTRTPPAVLRGTHTGKRHNGSQNFLPARHSGHQERTRLAHDRPNVQQHRKSCTVQRRVQPGGSHASVLGSAAPGRARFAQPAVRISLGAGWQRNAGGNRLKALESGAYIPPQKSQAQP